MVLKNIKVTRIIAIIFTIIITICAPPLLGMIDLSSRGLVKIPENIYGRVITLILTSNNLTELQDHSLRSYRDLESLLLKNNSINLVQKKAFQGLNKLETLDMSNNKLKYIYQDTFAHLVKLEELYLDSNPLKAVSSNSSLIVSKSLTSLSIRNANLTQVNIYTFSELPNLQYLDLSSNKLEDIPEDFFASLERLEQLVLIGNPWCSGKNREILAKNKMVVCWMSDGEEAQVTREDGTTWRSTESSTWEVETTTEKEMPSVDDARDKDLGGQDPKATNGDTADTTQQPVIINNSTWVIVSAIVLSVVLISLLIGIVLLAYFYRKRHHSGTDRKMDENFESSEHLNPEAVQ